MDEPFLYLWILESTSMSTINIPQNGLPQEIAGIPYGQVIVLTNPELGITAKHITIIEAIFKLATICGQGHIINTISVQDSGLWDCYACKVKTDKGVQILLSDKDSLFEMLCEFWGLDYEEVSKSIVLDGRSKYIPIGGESHPVRVSVKPAVKSDGVKKDLGTNLQLLPDHSKPGTLSDIRNAFQDIFYHNLGISIDEITDLYEEVKKSTKSYHLIIDVKKDDESGKIISCKFILEDNLGNKYELMKPRDKKGKHPLEEWETQWKALYLTFIWFKEGFPVIDILTDEEFYQTFLTILGQFPKGYSKPDKKTIWENAKSKFSKIRKSIMEATNDTYAREQFSIDGYRDDVYMVAGATDENRETIKREFGL